MFAEVWDKEPGLTAVWCLGIFFCLLAVLAVAAVPKPWGTVAGFAIAGFSALATWTWLGDPDEGPAIVQELGRNYARQGWIAGFLPCAVALAGVLVRHGKAVVAGYFLAVVATVVGVSQSLIFKDVPPVPLALWFPVVVIVPGDFLVRAVLGLLQFPLFAMAFQCGIKRWAVGRVLLGLVLIYGAMAGMALAIVRLVWKR